MPKSPSGPIRRGQLIAPFGVGAMVIVPGGASLIIGGLDYWFLPKDEKRKIDPEEFKVYEWRLQRLLNVSHFRLPPDYRDSFQNKNSLNIGLTVPAFRFPTWHFCPSCRLLEQSTLYASGKRGKLKCKECESKKKTRYLFQVPFVAMCENGHIQDFPWREWVHSESNPTCKGKLRLISTGSATLAGQKVKCEGEDCGKERTLAGITSATATSGTTTLSKTLCNNGEPFLCEGKKPWLGEDESEQCGAQLRGSLRSASNLYFSKVLSSIYLPITEDKDLQQVEITLQKPPVSTLISLLMDLVKPSLEDLVQAIRRKEPRSVSDFSDAQIYSTLKSMFDDQKSPFAETEFVEDETTKFRRAEYPVLKAERNDKFLTIKQANLNEYKSDLGKYFSRIMLVSKLRETRVLSGFTRVVAENNQNRDQRQALLCKKIPPHHERWLPAYTVFGEGLFFEFSEERLQIWESRKDVTVRVSPLIERNKEIQEKRHIHGREISPRFVLLHTVAHLLMNRLVFECGYSSAALRERIYTSIAAESPMAGILIYTADGDSEGTMGGLVRMGKPGKLEPVILRAIENAKWCSADPVCMELGESKGQGPDSSNLAACHNCALVPETACEEFNRFLDRGVVVGDFENRVTGYFDF